MNRNGAARFQSRGNTRTYLCGSQLELQAGVARESCSTRQRERPICRRTSRVEGGTAGQSPPLLPSTTTHRGCLKAEAKPSFTPESSTRRCRTKIYKPLARTAPAYPPSHRSRNSNSSLSTSRLKRIKVHSGSHTSSAATSRTNFDAEDGKHRYPPYRPSDSPLGRSTESAQCATQLTGARLR